MMIHYVNKDELMIIIGDAKMNVISGDVELRLLFESVIEDDF